MQTKWTRRDGDKEGGGTLEDLDIYVWVEGGGKEADIQNSSQDSGSQGGRGMKALIKPSF